MQSDDYLEQSMKLEGVLDEYNAADSETEINIFLGFLLFPLIKEGEIHLESLLDSYPTGQKRNLPPSDISVIKAYMQSLVEKDIFVQEPSGYKPTKKGSEMVRKLKMIYRPKP